MIDLSAEKLIRAQDVPKLLPPRHTGKPVHVSAVYRWIQRGVQGVRLEYIKIGGTTYTSKEALQRFANRRSPENHDATAVPTTTATRRKQIERAEREVQALLHGGRRPKTSG